MKFLLTYTSGNIKEIKVIKTLEQLIRFMKKENHPLIINEIADYEKKGQFKSLKYSIEVYDDYRE